MKNSVLDRFSINSILPQICYDIIENSEIDYIVLRLPDFVYEYANKTAVERNKKAGNYDIIGKNLSELWGTKAEPIIQMIDQVVSSGQVKQVKELQLGENRTDSNRQDEYYDLTFHPVRIGNDIRYILIQSSEVTERVRQKQLKDNVITRFQAISAAVDDGILLLDSNGKVLLANETFYKIHGMEESSAIPSSTDTARQFFQLFDQDGLTVPFKDWPFFRAIRGEKVLNQEYKAVNEASGVEFIGLFSAVPVYEEDEIQYVVISIKDITSMVLAKRKLEKNERLLKLIIDNSQDGIHLLNLKTGKYEFMSPAQEELTGFSLDELMLDLETAAGRLHPEDEARVNKYLDDVINDRHPGKPVEYRWKTKNDEYRWFSDNRRLIRDDKGNPHYLVGISRDIEGRKMLELEILQKNDLLENFSQLQKNLLYMVAHDLKNPISNLKMLLKIWEKDNSQVTVENFHTVLNQIQNRFEIVTAGLTEILKTEEDTSGLEVEALEIDSFILKVLEENRPQLSECKAEVKFNPGNIQFRYVNTYLYSIISNIISNAIKYRDSRRQLEIEIEIYRQESFLVISISDNGIGIDMESNRNWLFKPFKRFSNHTHGTGVGLYLINNLVTKNGGRIEVDSTLGSGTTVSCFLSEYC